MEMYLPLVTILKPRYD